MLKPQTLPPKTLSGAFFCRMNVLPLPCDASLPVANGRYQAISFKPQVH
jgi:hypothetical protein